MNPPLLSIVILSVQLQLPCYLSSQPTRESVLSLRDRLLNNYRKEERPVKQYSETCLVHLRWSPMSIKYFDEVSGVLSIVSNFVLYWQDEFLKWNTDGNDLPTNILLNKNLIWRPELAILNSATTSTFDGKNYEKVRARKNGYIRYKTAAKVLRTTCIPNMQFYPTDEHTCLQQVMITDYYPHEVTFGNKSTLVLAQFQKSSKWEVKKWKLSRGAVKMSPETSFPLVTLTVVLKRKPSFILVNMISPVLLLSIINVFVFGLPVVSGERISYSMTTFLSLAVYMTIIAEKLPDGNPVPMFAYFIVGKLVYSSLIILCTIIGLQLHHGKDSALIRKCASLSTRLRLLHSSGQHNWFAKNWQRFLTRKNKVRKIEVATFDSLPMEKKKISKEKPQPSENSQTGDESFDENKSTSQETFECQQAKWKRIGKVFDRACLVVFLSIVMSEITAWIILTWFV